MILTGGNTFGGEGGNVGIGFAVPSNMAKQVMDQIETKGRVSRGYMGVTLQTVTPELAPQFGLKDQRGAVITEVTPNGPGAKAGLKQGDVIVAIDGKKVESNDDATMQVISRSPGSSVNVEIVRNNQPTTVTVTLGTRPGGVDWNKQNNNNDNSTNPDEGDNSGNATVRGITVETLTPDLAQQLNAPGSLHGVVVDSVAADSPAADNVVRGMVITAVNRQQVNNVSDFKRLMGQSNGKAALITFWANGQPGFTVVQAQ
jgi:serine protease Do